MLNKVINLFVNWNVDIVFFKNRYVRIIVRIGFLIIFIEIVVVLIVFNNRLKIFWLKMVGIMVSNKK